MGRKHKEARKWTGVQIVHPNAAGLDVASDSIYACVPPDRAEQPVRCFGTYTPDLKDLADWLKGCGVDTVAMESTGVYWIPIYEVLDASGLNVQVVNARHLMHAPGRKSDVQDCQWIQEMHTIGLLNASFRPDAEMCVLRAYLRQRSMLIEHRAAHIQHMQKAMRQMNVVLTEVLSDITGGTGMRIVRAITEGEQNPEVLAALRDPKCAKTSEEFIKALTGNYREEHLFALRQALSLYDTYTAQVLECDRELERLFSNMKPIHDDELPPLDRSDKRDSKCKNAPTYDARGLLYELLGVDLVAITGLNQSTVQTIISEIGTDLSAFPTVKCFCSWLGLAPHNDISGGTVLKSKTLKTHNKAGQAFRMAAQSVSHNSDSAFGAFYRRMCMRVGSPQAIVATAHKIARVFYHMLKHRVPFTKVTAEEYDQQVRDRKVRRVRQEASKLGFRLVEIAAPA